jgi:hypothetical protein
MNARTGICGGRRVSSAETLTSGRDLPSLVKPKRKNVSGQNSRPSDFGEFIAFLTTNTKTQALSPIGRNSLWAFSKPALERRLREKLATARNTC